MNHRGHLRAFTIAMSILALAAGHAVKAQDNEVFAPQAGKGWWAFSPPADTFDSASKLDLRGLNETTAGEHGFIAVSGDGQGFVRGDGQAIRFWAGTVAPDNSHAGMDEQARFLAKRGVNMVRWHGDLSPQDRPDSQITDVNEAALDQVFYLVAAMKKQGIYVTISPYWAFADAVQDDKGARLHPNWPIPRDPAARTTMALLFFDPVMIDAYQHWVKALLTRVNPYTGIALKDDPAVAIFQIQNEDSLLFWTFNSLGGGDRDLIEHQFGDWLVKRYGSLAAAQAAWDHAGPGDGAATRDRLEAGMMALPNLYPLTQPVDEASGQGRRYADATEFLTTVMHDFNAAMTGYVRNTLGARQLVNPDNWRTASMANLNDAERYAYTPGDVMAVNRYVTGIHAGSDTASWAVAKGEHFTSVSTLSDIGQVPLALKQVAGHPMMVTESLWVAPNAYESEGPFVVSALQSLDGVAGYYWFSLGEMGQWEQPRSANGYLPSIGKFVANTPMTLGQFPAAALMYREGYIQPAPRPVMFEHRTLDDLWLRRGPVIAEEGGFDPNRDVAPYAAGKATGVVSPLAYLTGPVRVDYGVAKPDEIMDLSPYIDVKAKTVTSLTGEMQWNFGAGVVRVDTPRAQGVSGFLAAGGGRYGLHDTVITSSNAYAAIYVVSLDGTALATSHRVLIQVGTQARPSGWVDKASTWVDDDKVKFSGRDIVATGGAPWLVADTQGEVRIRNLGLRKATILDANGMAMGAAVVKRSGKDVVITLPKDALYIVVED